MGIGCPPGCQVAQGWQGCGTDTRWNSTGLLTDARLLQHKGHTWEVPPANTGTVTPTGNHPDLLNKFYPTYRTCKTKLYLSELVISENEQSEIYRALRAPVWAVSPHQMAKIISWGTCSVNGKQSVFSISEASFDRLVLKCSWNILPWHSTFQRSFRQAASISAK